MGGSQWEVVLPTFLCRHLQCLIHFLNSEDGATETQETIHLSRKPKLGAHRPWSKPLPQFGGDG